MTPYQVSPEAVKDLDGIWLWVATHGSIAAAERLLESFLHAFRSLSHSPSVGVAVPRVGKPGTRRFPVGNYLIYYRPVGRKSICVLRVLHGKRQQARSFRAKP